MGSFLIKLASWHSDLQLAMSSEGRESCTCRVDLACGVHVRDGRDFIAFLG